MRVIRRDAGVKELSPAGLNRPRKFRSLIGRQNERVDDGRLNLEEDSYVPRIVRVAIGRCNWDSSLYDPLVPGVFHFVCFSNKFSSFYYPKSTVTPASPGSQNGYVRRLITDKVSISRG